MLTLADLKISRDVYKEVTSIFLTRKDSEQVKDTLKAVVSVLPEGIAMFD